MDLRATNRTGRFSPSAPRSITVAGSTPRVRATPAGARPWPNPANAICATAKKDSKDARRVMCNRRMSSSMEAQAPERDSMVMTSSGSPGA